MTKKIPEKGEAEVQEFQTPLDPPAIAVTAIIATTIHMIVSAIFGGFIRIAKASINAISKSIQKKSDDNKAVIKPPMDTDSTYNVNDDKTK